MKVGRRGRERLQSKMPPVDGPVRDLGPGREPAFSPSGEWMVYSVLSGRVWSLFRIRADGSGRRGITGGD